MPIKRKNKLTKFQRTYKKVRQILDEIYQESMTIPENFGEEICKEVTNSLIEDNYTPTKELVTEALFWGYIVKMQ